MKPYDVLGQAATALDDPVIITGRYSFQSEACRKMAADVIAKVQPKPDHRVLEIGCGTGLILNSIAPLVKEAIGMDHPNILARYRELGVPPNVTLFPGEWPINRPEGTFDLILVYSVFVCLTSENDAATIAWTALEHLRPNGVLFLGDLPNRDARTRFVTSPTGRAFAEDWARLKANSEVDVAAYRQFFSKYDGHAGSFGCDAFTLKLLAEARAKGYESYLLPQPPDLPFGNTREDILIRRRG
jgi:protein-L-isoaspartate O-methyltransferase